MRAGAGNWGLAAGAAVVAIAAALLAGCSTSKPLPDYGPVPEFQLTAQTGQPFDSKSLRGHVWVADFIYTTCPGPCPMMTADMHRLQVKTAGMPDVKLVSFTVDPATDTPPVLAVYAKNFSADPARWYFLTGPQSRLNTIGFNTFHLNQVDGKLNHSTRFSLVDAHGRIRGYYLTSDADFMQHLLTDIRQLEHERT